VAAIAEVAAGAVAPVLVPAPAAPVLVQVAVVRKLRMEIQRVGEVTQELVAAFERLIPQLSPHSIPPSSNELAELLASPNTYLYTARDEHGKIVGSLTLVFYRTPTALHAWIEDVIVDETVRGQGLGTTLTQVAIEQAQVRGAKCVNLTSRPAREAANRLYQHLGFTHWETNAYRYDLKG
jgi:ribosomal protein S18 acetylase RimI-like enzyme